MNFSAQLPRPEILSFHSGYSETRKVKNRQAKIRLTMASLWLLSQTQETVNTGYCVPIIAVSVLDFSFEKEKLRMEGEDIPPYISCFAKTGTRYFRSPQLD